MKKIASSLTLLLLMVTFPVSAQEYDLPYSSLEEFKDFFEIDKDLPSDFDWKNFDLESYNEENDSKVKGLNILPNTVDCFDYYEFNSVNIEITNEVDTVLPGVEQTFSVELTNQNPYPLVDGKLYIKIFRQRENEVDTQINGDHIVDSFTALEHVMLQGGGATSTTFSWTPSQYLPGGRYYIASYFITSDRFNLAGLSFTDDIIGGRSDFSIVGEDVGFYFDKDAVTLGDEVHQFIAAPPHFEKYDTIEVSAPIKNDSDEDRIGLITWNIYYWDAQLEEHLVDTVEEAVLVPAKGVASISYDLINYNHAVYLVVPTLTYNSEIVSILNVRPARIDIDEPRINFPALTSFPLKAGTETTLFSCLHNGGINDLVQNTALTLTLSDTYGDTIHSYTYEGGTTGEMMAVKDTFTPELSYNTVDLTATLSQGEEIIDEVTITYNCTEIDPESCVALSISEEPSPIDDILRRIADMKFIIFAFVGLLVLAGMVSNFMRRSEITDNFNK